MKVSGLVQPFFTSRRAVRNVDVVNATLTAGYCRLVSDELAHVLLPSEQSRRPSISTDKGKEG